jgi:glycosyltransferase involved in cell wall biosynthesis
VLAERIEQELAQAAVKPVYIIRNGTYFRRINTDVHTISLIQDVTGNDSQIDVINNSQLVVFNTNYVYDKYRTRISDKVPVRICPLGVNFDFFKPIGDRNPDVLPNSILFIGASTTYPKGFNIMMDIMNTMTDQNFCLIMKDSFSLSQLPESTRPRVRIFNRIPPREVRMIINSCVVAVCTSFEETQHLSGIECAACNIPIVARAVGVYYDNRESQEWGLLAENSTFVEKLRYVRDNLDKFSPRDCFIKQYSTDQCKTNWIDIVSKFKESS